MKALNSLIKSFLEGGILTNEELNLIVSHINQIVDYINNNIKPAIENGIKGRDGRDGVNGRNGTSGESGISSLNAFVGASSDNAALQKLGDRNLNSYPPGQYSISSNVSIGENEILYMTSARRLGENNWLYGNDGYIWSVPVQLGSNTTSTTGTDSDKINYIYCRTTRGVDALDYFPQDVALQRSIIDYVEEYPGNGIRIYLSATSTVANLGMSSTEAVEGAWTDHPWGVTEVLPHEWMVGFKKNAYNLWEHYFGPVMISNYGLDGLDADGLEYIFTANASNNSLTLNPPYSGTIGNNNLVLTGVTVDSENYLNDDFIPSGWFDEPVEATKNIPYVYVSTRKQHKDLNGKSVWGAFTQPKLWGVFATDGVNGQYTLFIYLNSATLPNTPSGNMESIPNDWTLRATSPSTGEYTWCSTRDVTFSVNTNLPSYGNWCTPYRITGEDGEPGTDGNFIEFIYTRNNTGIVPPAPPLSGTYLRDWPNVDGNTPSATITVDGLQYTWYDNPQGTASGMKWEFVSSREYDGTTKTWGPYSTPGIWSKFGEDGRDGDGFEYIFKGFSTEPNWNNVSSDDYPPNWTSLTGFLDSDYMGPTGHLWEDDAIAVDNTNNKFVYMCSRKKYTDSGEARATWHQFSTPKLWALYVAPGTAGPAGLYTQFIFRTTSTDLSNTSLGNTESSLPEYWSEAATSPSSTSEYIWGSHRTITPGLNNTVTYGNWNTPYRISGKNGNDSDGANSMKYIITTSVNEIKYSLNHADVWSLDPDLINIRVYKFTGTAMEEVNPVELNHDVYVRIQRQDSTYLLLSKISLGDNYVTGNSSRPNLYKYTVSGIQYPAKSILIIYAEKDGSTYYYKAIKDISVRRVYLRMLIPMGEYDEDKDYEIDESTIPLVYCGGSYYFLDAPSNIGDNNTHIAPTDDNNTVWAEATNYKVLLTDALFANFAKLGSFVIYDKYFFSQFGYVIDSSGNVIYKDSSSNVLNYYLYFDPTDPMGYDSPSNWVQKGWTESYKFRPMKVINAESGEEWMAGGKVYIDVNGKVTMNDIYVKNGVTSHKVKTLHRGYGNQQNTLEYYMYLWNNENTDNEYYYPLDLSLTCDHLFIVGDGSNNRKITIHLPPAHYFIGQRIIITNNTINYISDSINIMLDYYYYINSNKIIVLTNKEFMDGGKYYSEEEDEGVPFIPLNNIIQEGHYMASGIWSPRLGGESADNDYIYMSCNVDNLFNINDYEWVEFTAVEGILKNSSAYTTNGKDEELNFVLKFNAIWMLSRWEKKLEELN